MSSLSVPLPRIDFGVAATDYAEHRKGPPDELYDRLARWYGVGLPGQDLVDLGTGTGNAARVFAARGARVVGVDPSPPLLAQAVRLAASAGLDVAGRHARAEARRVLRSGGTIAILHFDWLSLPGSVVELTLSLVDHHRAGAPPPIAPDGICHNGVYPYWADDLAVGGFTAIEHMGFDIYQPYTHEAWRGRMRSAALVHTMPPAAQAAFDDDHARALAMGFPRTLQVPHRVFAVIARSTR